MCSPGDKVMAKVGEVMFVGYVLAEFVWKQQKHVVVGDEFDRIFVVSSKSCSPAGPTKVKLDKYAGDLEWEGKKE